MAKGSGSRTPPDLLRPALLLLFAAIILGGASRLDVPSYAAVNLVSLACVGWMVWRAPTGTLRLRKAEFWLLGAIVAVPIFQLVPLPWPVWTSLGGRGDAAALYSLMGERPWRPISLSPDHTIVAALSLVAPVAAYFLAAQVGRVGQGRMLTLLLVLALAGALLGIVQFASGPASPLRFYAITNNDSGVGFFANANHQALFLAIGAALCFWQAGERMVARAQALSIPTIIVFTLAALTLLGAALVVTWSRAGMLLLLLGCLSGVALLPIRAARRRWVGTLMAATPLVGMAAIAWIMLRAAPVSPMAVDGILSEGRVANLPLLGSMIRDLMPFGSGLGTFDRAFRAYEPLEDLTFLYWNQAHNDFAQIAIEAGLLGVAATFGFIIWWVSRFIRLFRASDAADARVRQARAAAIAIALILVHSLVDYPLRTPALSVVFAICCAIVARAPSGIARRVQGTTS